MDAQFKKFLVARIGEKEVAHIEKNGMDETYYRHMMKLYRFMKANGRI